MKATMKKTIPILMFLLLMKDRGRSYVFRSEDSELSGLAEKVPRCKIYIPIST